MPMKFSFGEIKLGARTESASAPEPAGDDTPFRIAIFGDFSGRASRGVCEPGARIAKLRPLAVDRDNLEQVMAKLGVELHVPVGNTADARMPLRFKELDDFRPESLFQRVPIFEKLRETRAHLENPATFAAAAAEVRGWSQAPAAAGSQEASPALPASGAELLAQILGEPMPTRTQSPATAGSDEWNAFLRKAVAPHVVSTEELQKPGLIAQVDGAMAGLMRALLHQPLFQALEATWRGVALLVRRLETDGPLRLFLFDISQEELAADLAAMDDLSTTGTYNILIGQIAATPGAHPWAVLASNYALGPRRADVELLGRVAKLAQCAGAPFLAAAEPGMVGCDSLAQTPDPDDWNQPIDHDFAAAWDALRGLPEAAYLGLAMPRFLLRAPYGRDADTVEQLDFEEMPQPRHDNYLWGNPAIAAAYLLGAAFGRHGWGMRPGAVQDIEGMPVHVFDRDGEKTMQPGAETLLPNRAVAKIADRGLMVLQSFQGQDSVRLAEFRSLAQSGELVGRWR